MNNQTLASMVGYFDDPSQTKPAFDPGLDVLCPYCLHGPLTLENVRTISLMGVGSKRSHFYRAHKTCAETAAPEDEERIEDGIIDALAFAPENI